VPRLEEGQKIRVPPLKLAQPATPAVKRISPEDQRAIREMTLFEDKHVLVLNKPFGLAVQGGSGTRRHIDGMLEAMAVGGCAAATGTRTSGEVCRQPQIRAWPPKSASSLPRKSN
jgi:23S rRNA-/tRNA-specific pseudouridylate synthase